MLIDFENITEESKDKAVITAVKMSKEISTESLRESVLPRLVKACAFQFVSNGHWSMHQLLQLLLSQTGQADVYISSYAFSELPARVIAKLKNDGIIQNLHCIIDSRVDTRSAGALQLMRNTAERIKLCATHAKVTVVTNNKWNYTVIGSANYTTNKRYESGLVFENKELAAKNVKWIMKEIQNDD